MDNRVWAQNVYGIGQKVTMGWCCWEDADGVIVGDERVVALYLNPRRGTQKMRVIRDENGFEHVKIMNLGPFYDLWEVLRHAHT